MPSSRTMGTSRAALGGFPTIVEFLPPRNPSKSMPKYLLDALQDKYLSEALFALGKHSTNRIRQAEINIF